MASSAIQWTDFVWNPTIGCERVSEGCQYCYAERQAHRNELMGNRDYFGLTKQHGDKTVNWTGVVRELPERLYQPLHWKKPKRIFVDSMSDLFHKDVSDFFIGRVLAVIASTPQHTFQVLTKRPERMAPYMTGFYKAAQEMGVPIPNPIPNLHVGTSTENQDAADERIRHLLVTPAAVRFISAEPLLGPIEHLPLKAELVDVCDGKDAPVWLPAGSIEVESGSRVFAKSGIDWVIVGGESGFNRPPERSLVEACTHWDCGFNDCSIVKKCQETCSCQGTGWRPKYEPTQWVRSIRHQCQAAGVPFFFKQWGGPGHASAGRILDGQTWDQFPEKAPGAE